MSLGSYNHSHSYNILDTIGAVQIFVNLAKICKRRIRTLPLCIKEYHSDLSGIVVGIDFADEEVDIEYFGHDA